MTKMYLTTMLLFLSTFSYQIFAHSILLLDFNDNQKTAEVVRQYAAENGDKLYHFGSQSLPISKETFEKYYSSIRSEFADANTLKTVVFSGHHGNYSFSGSTGELKLNDLIAVLQKFGDSWSDVDTAILRGCYTVTAESILPDSPWLALFPNAKVIAGFEKKAWDDLKPMSYEFISTALYFNTEELVASDKERLIDVFKSIPHQRKSALGLWVKSNVAPEGGFYLSTENGFNGKPILDNESAISQCNLNYPSKQFFASVLDEYVSGARVIPHNTSRSSLRKAYDFMNLNNHCYHLSSRWIEDRVNHLTRFDDEHNLEKTMPVLFFHNIVKNMNRYLTHTVSVNWFEEWQSSLQSDEIIDLPSYFSAIEHLDELSYGELQNMKLDIQSIMHNQKAKSPAQMLVNFVINKTILDVDPLVLPQRWMTEESSYAVPLLLPFAEPNFLNNKIRRRH